MGGCSHFFRRLIDVNFVNVQGGQTRVATIGHLLRPGELGPVRLQLRGGQRGLLQAPDPGHVREIRIFHTDVINHCASDLLYILLKLCVLYYDFLKLLIHNQSDKEIYYQGSLSHEVFEESIIVSLFCLSFISKSLHFVMNVF